MAELDTLEEAWNNGTCRFRKLTPAEFETWKAQQDTPEAGNDISSDSDNENDNGSTSTARPPAIHAVATQGGAMVSVTQPAPRKRRSDYQGTHQTKKRAVESGDGTPVAASSSHIPPQSPALSSRRPSQSPAPCSRIMSQSPALTSTSPCSLPAPVPRIPSQNIASSSRLSSQSPQLPGGMMWMSPGATNMSAFGSPLMYNATQSPISLHTSTPFLDVPDPLMMALNSPSHGTSSPALSASYHAMQSMLPPHMPGLPVPDFTFPPQSMSPASSAMLPPPMPGLDLPGFSFNPPQPMSNLTPAFNNHDPVDYRTSSRMSLHGGENIAPNGGMFSGSISSPAACSPRPVPPSTYQWSEGGPSYT